MNTEELSLVLKHFKVGTRSYFGECRDIIKLVSISLVLLLSIYSDSASF